MRAENQYPLFLIPLQSRYGAPLQDQETHFKA